MIDGRMAIPLRAAIAMALCAALPHMARADAASKCSVAVFARLPVVMDGPRASVPATINGKATRVWLDSGAFFNVMPKAKAVELGLVTKPLPDGYRVAGIGGSYKAELATVRDFGLAGSPLHNMEFVVGGNDTGNAFLGANLLGVVDTEFDLAKGRLNLFKPSGCGQINLAYWSPGMTLGVAQMLAADQSGDRHIYVEVLINGHHLRAMLDTGAPTSVINRLPAERAGIDLKSPQVLKSATMSGLGSQQRQTWIARPATISIGGEEIRNSPIHVIDDTDGYTGWDMLLGVDFLMAHHVLVSQSQRVMYLTYNGGPIFSTTTDSETGHLETRAEGMGKAETAIAPRTADEFAGRGSGRLLRDDLTGAIADYTEAVRLAPGRADLLSDRAKAYARNKQTDFAARDLDAALAITPTDHDLLARRAGMRLRKGDKAGALADTDAAAADTPRGSFDNLPLVLLYQRLGKAARGLALLDPVIDLHHGDPDYLALLNTRNWNRGLANVDLDRALADSNRVVRDAGPSSIYLETRALVQLRRNDLAAAIADAGASLTQAKKRPYALFVRGLARLASGDADGGMADIAAARALRPAIDQGLADYGLTAPKTQTRAPAQPDGDGDGDDDYNQ